MNLDGIRDQLTPVFRDVMDRDDIVLSDALTAEDVEEWDSLSHIRLMVAVEKRFSVRFTNAEIAGLKDVGELVRLIAMKRQDRNT
jgi:acyl carrier protein